MGRLEDLSLFDLVIQGLRRNIIVFCKYIEGINTEGREQEEKHCTVKSKR